MAIWMYMPTLPVVDAKELIVDMLKSNAGCRYPCWWGLTPGETKIQFGNSFLKKFEALSIGYISDEYGAYTSWFITEEDLILDISVDTWLFQENPDPLRGLVEGLHVRTQVKRSIEGGFEVVYDNPLYAKYLQAYMLPQILSTYGKPNNVLIFGNKGWYELDLVLDYADQGFIIRYSSPLESVGENFLGCMSKGYMDLHLWDPELTYTWAEGVTRTSGGEDWEIDWLATNFLSLEKVTSMTVNEFYQTFQQPDNTTCFETPMEIWPER
jgi:hypothetical protein